MVDIRLRQLSIKMFMLRCKNAVATYGYLPDGATGQPEVGNVLMDNQTELSLGLLVAVISKRKSEQSRYRYQAFSSFNHKAYIVWYLTKV